MVISVWFNLPYKEPVLFTVPEKFKNKICRFARIFAEIGGEKQPGLVYAIHELANIPDSRLLKNIIRPLDTDPIITEEQYHLAEKIAKYYFCETGQVLFSMIPTGRRETFAKIPVKEEHENSIALPPMNPAQTQIVQTILKTRGPQEPHIHLLYGITGSGKTRVYLELIRYFLNEGSGVILLLPEIALSWQFALSMKPLFGEKLAILHSALGTAQRFREYKRLLRGEARLAIGTRSAVFAPVKNLGLVILDEEHDGSYQEHGTPAYHARRIAFMRLSHGVVGNLPATLIFGSASPSLETLYFARKKVYHLHELTQRATGQPLPQITIPSYHPKMGIISPFLQERMRIHLQKGKQVILLLNRRGHSTSVFCEKCANTQGCPNCSISLTYHNDKTLRCHQCGYQENYTPHCPVCNANRILLGRGTQRVEEILEHQFSEYVYARLDQDTARVKDYSRDVLQAFREGKIQILLGTQMIAKGFDLPGVTLVAVLNADIGLAIPDFRSQERIFQLLMQVSGRSGRHERGEVVFQTMQPENTAIKAAALNLPDVFYLHELAMREAVKYPPYTRLFRIVFTSSDELAVVTAGRKTRDFIQSQLSQTNLFEQEIKYMPEEIYGPVAAPVSKIKNEFRVHIVLKDRSFNLLHSFMENLRNQFLLKWKYLNVRFKIEIDPQDML